MLQSLALVFLLGIGAKRIFETMKLPGLVGLVFLGILLGPVGLNWLEQGFLTLSSEIRLFALITILLRAGLGLNRSILKRIGRPALKMSALPGICEGLVIMLLSHYLLGFTWQQGGILGFMIAAVSPAVVVPSMLALRDRGLGNNKNIPMLILAGASLDDVFAVTMFSVFLGLSLGQAAGPEAWLPVTMVPLEILGGFLLGIVAGLLMHWLLKRIALDETDQLLLVLGTGIAVTIAGNYLSLAGLLAVMGLGFVLQERGNGYISALSDHLNHLWVALQLFLFVLIGAAVDPGVVVNAGFHGLLIIAAGLLARSFGVFLATAGTRLNRNEKVFCALAYLPKATVQAAVGGIPLAMGIPGGEIMLAIAVLSVIVTAPLGAAAIKHFAPVLLQADEVNEGGSS